MLKSHRDLIMKYFLLAILLMVNTTVLADSNDVSKYFDNKSGCYILYDVNQNKVVEQFGAKHCEKRIAAHSTFKIPLSVMAFDQHLISQNTVFEWDKKERWLPDWNKNQTPKSWLTYSIVWVSQELTPKIGMTKIKNYLNKFHYGNQDFSGDPGKNNGLTHAWLSSSLKISANEQLEFLKALVKNNLHVSKQSMDDTKDNMYLETLANGWKLYGKTGSSEVQQGEGWFVGFIQHAEQTYIFVVNFTDLKIDQSHEYGGPRAKAILKKLLSIELV